MTITELKNKYPELVERAKEYYRLGTIKTTKRFINSLTGQERDSLGGPLGALKFYLNSVGKNAK